MKAKKFHLVATTDKNPKWKELIKREKELYKVYDGSRESSYGIEYQDSEKTITKKVLESYISISNSAQEVKNPDEIDIV